MSLQIGNLETRISTVNAAVTNDSDRTAVAAELRAAKGDWSAALNNLKDKLSADTLAKVVLAHSLADWSGDNVPVVKALVTTPGITSLRDVALNYDVSKLTALVDGTSVAVATALHHQLFTREPSAVLQRMVQTAEIPIADTNVRTGVTTFLNNQPDFNIRTTSVYTALRNPAALEGVAPAQHGAVVDQLKILQRVQAISPVPEAMPALVKANLTSAFHVAEMPQSTFLKAHGKALGGQTTAQQVYTSAVNTRIRNEHALMTMRESIRGTGLAVIDGQQTRTVRLAALQRVADQQNIPINLEKLFGSTDYCACDNCTSVYSAASYFVELLQFLRSNNTQNPDPTDISGTPLDMLFRRRPDLGCLELTCANTNTVLPYIDLANEVMESFIVHQQDYDKSKTDPKQATIDVFNVEGETSNELLAQPQHINYQAYCILKNAVYPFTLPYHQPIDAIRIFLKYLNTSRCELLDTFRSAPEKCTSPGITPARQDELNKLHELILDRAVDAEFLGMTQEEYIIITRRAFWPRRYFELTQNKTISDPDYQTSIGVKPVYQYYGYADDADMVSTDETQQIGLTFVKKQLLPRTGIQYTDLVDLLKTQFINPLYPQGQALTILDSIRASYRDLQTLVDKTSKDPKVRFAKLVAFLEKDQWLVPLLHRRLHPDRCQQQHCTEIIALKDLRDWVYCYFEKLGKLIVLDLGQGPRLDIQGRLFFSPPSILKQRVLVGYLQNDGTIVGPDQTTVIGHVAPPDAKVTWLPQAPPNIIGQSLELDDENNEFLGQITSDGLLEKNPDDEDPLTWLAPQDSCDLSKVRITHLDGGPLCDEEYDRIQRFVRLWNKLGWTIDETDKALVGLSTPPTGATRADECHHVGFDAFIDDCAATVGGTDGCCDGDPDVHACPPDRFVPSDISPHFLSELVAVRKLLDLTGLPLPQLLAFWANISTVGDHSLYASLFLTHNMVALDGVFQADKNGNYLTQAAKISDHIPVLMAALGLKANDIAVIMTLSHMADALTLANVSALVRHARLARLLHVKVSDLPDVITLFGAPFQDAYHTLGLLQTWGKMQDAGFTFRQLAYVIKDLDDPLRPLAPSQRTVLQVTRTLYDGLNAIDQANPDVSDQDHATSALVSTSAGMIFNPEVVGQILGLLEGTTVYSVNAPANLTITVPPGTTLASKLKYSNQATSTPPLATVQVTGILTRDEQAQAKALSSAAGWSTAIDRVFKKAVQFFNDVLFGIFPDVADAQNHLLAGDVIVPAAQLDPGQPDPSTAPGKRFHFLTSFLPFLRRRLAHQLIVDTMSGTANLAGDVTDLLLSNILRAGTPAQPAIDVLLGIKQAPPEGAGNWTGYLIPTVSDSYTFLGVGDSAGLSPPPPLTLDGQTIPFLHQQDDPTYLWASDPVTLKRATLYPLAVSGQAISDLQWKTSTAPPAAIPASALLPDYSVKGTRAVFVELYKAALVINGFRLSATEVGYLQAHAADFDGFDWNAITLPRWLRLQAYTQLRNSLPQMSMTLLDLFQWATRPDDPGKLGAQIVAATGWTQTDVDKLIAPAHFDLDRPGAFTSEVNLITLQAALTVAGKIGMDIDKLFQWAMPGSKFWPSHQIAEDIRKAIHSGYSEDDWEQVVKPLNNQLREDQKQALISYLRVQPDLIKWGVTDADGLFEFFLIDVQMQDCMETSRIVQAISSVQLFVQRCLLGQEKDVPPAQIDQDRWAWMQKYRVWQANREVFLYPENWIEPTLRDDKSPFYKDLESALLQKDINTQNLQDAVKNYLFALDGVANLKIVGLFLDSDGGRLHIFGRTWNAPYLFYYRYFDTSARNWYPWTAMQLDIPSYDLEDASGNITGNGTYLAPVVWNQRLLVFFPQFAKKTAPPSNKPASGKIGKPDSNGNQSVDLPTPGPAQAYWEIKLGWSEYRNGKWTQKQMSADALYEAPADPLPPIDSYEFIPRLISAPAMVAVDVLRSSESKAIGRFDFSGSQIAKDPAVPGPVGAPDQRATTFQYINTTQLHSLQATDGNDPPYQATEPYFDVTPTSVIVHDQADTQDGLKFYHPFAHQLLGTLTSGKLDDLFTAYLQRYYAGTSDSTRPNDDTYGADRLAVYHELKRAYSLYNWELGFHAPMELADRLFKSQQFDQALAMCHHVFNPMSSDQNDTSGKPYWAFPPFKEVDAENVLEKLFLGLQPGTPNDAINEWRTDPFQPHVVARSRPSAYMKWVVMEYIQILIAYGDYYFTQNTLETIPLAIQCYVMASHLYGPRGQTIPRAGKIQPETYRSLLDKWDAFGNAMVDLELVFPFSNQTATAASSASVAIANIFGSVTSLYFCIPDNPNLTALRDTIDDRLFKIRHCENIQGVVQQLPLFAPPINPALLVQAVAQGLSIASVLNDLNRPMPNYRFYYLLQKALELCSELKAFGNAFLSAKEKRDAEALASLRATQETAVQNLVMQVRTQQLDEAQKSLDALQQSRMVPVNRMQYYLKLIGQDLGKVPDTGADFSELPNTIEQPIDDSGLKLLSYEKEEMDKASSAADWQIGIGVVETLASIFHALPTMHADGHPLGIGLDVVWGFPNLASATEAVGRGLKIYADHLSYQSSSAGRKAGFLRALQDRTQQANAAGYEVKNIDKQILTQQVRIGIANQEITNQQKQIDNAQAVQDFLQSKYTNQDLYTWMADSIQTTYHQAYTLAYDLAKKAELTYRFERGLSDSSFIQYGYWDPGHDGLLAGESLYVALKQLEAAHQLNRPYDFEITKTISLRQVSPMALLQLRAAATCQFELPEILFDMDYPGHYMRRIKSVALTVPCVIGPYTGLNCTLRLAEHKFRTSAIAKSATDYPEKTDGSETRFSTTNVPITAIAASTGQNDSGVFELNFKDERYIPFEGAGAISKWQIDLPADFPQFDHDTISDVIIHLRYTSVDGGDKLKAIAAGTVKAFIRSVQDLSQQQGLFAAFDLVHDFATDWYKANHPAAGATTRVMDLSGLPDRLPVFTRIPAKTKVQASDVYLVTAGALPTVSLVQGTSDPQPFNPGPPIGPMKSFSLQGFDAPVKDWQLVIGDAKTVITKLWLVVRYTLG